MGERGWDGRSGRLAGWKFYKFAESVSADGSVIVGHGSSASGDEAFIWDSTNGMRSLQDILINDFLLGDSLTGWSLISAAGISDGGLTIAGFGSNPDGNTEAWVANLSDPPVVIPEPSTYFLFATVVIGIFALHGRRSRKSHSSQ